MSNREIEARLKLSAVDKTGNTFKNISNKMGEINKRAAVFNKQQSVFNQTSAAMYATVARYAAPAALAYGAKVALVDFAALERQMTRIGMTAGASTKQTTEAFAQAQKIAKDLKFDGVAPAIEAIDTLVASGKTLEEAMAFLPSVLATAQASGAATADIANTGIKAASALKIETSQLQRAFDIMVTGGKAGQFELKDMAQHIPDLANSFASLGYSGEDGLKRLVAILQTVREDTGSASSAATQAQNIFGKMFTSDTEKKFANFNINLRKEMKAAAAAGEDAISAFVRLSKTALDGDLSNLSLLFTDTEFRLGMQSLITSGDSLDRFLTIMNSAEVDGAVWRDVQRVMGDTQSSIDNMSSSWEKLKVSFGSTIAPMAVDAMDGLSNNLDYHGAVNAGLEKNGVNGFWERTQWGLGSSSEDKMAMAIAGGYSNREDIAAYHEARYSRGANKASSGRQNSRVVVPDFPGGATGAIPIPQQRPDGGPSVGDGLVAKSYAPVRSQPSAPTHAMAAMGQLPQITLPSKQELKDALRIDLGFKQQGAEAGAAVADGGKQAGAAIEDSAAFIRVAGYDVSTAIANAARELAAAVSRFPTQQGYVPGSGQRPPVNADTGRSMPPAASRPASGPK